MIFLLKKIRSLYFLYMLYLWGLILLSPSYSLFNMFRFVIRTTELYKYSGNLTEDFPLATVSTEKVRYRTNYKQTSCKWRSIRILDSNIEEHIHLKKGLHQNLCCKGEEKEEFRLVSPTTHWIIAGVKILIVLRIFTRVLARYPHNFL